jgi:hypothetical protein
MAAISSPSLTFPHPELTALIGEPTNASLQLLQKELYSNGRSIYSTRGGGANGHLAVIMPTADYLARAGVDFDTPIHPGNAPVHAVAATGNQITETNRVYKQAIDEHLLFNTVREQLKQQILKAVNSRYLQILENADFGYADVTPAAMLLHLKTTYGRITPEGIETNRNLLSATWSPDDPIEDLWMRIRDCQRYAVAAGEPITDGTAVRLILSVLEKTGVFTSAADKWRDKPEASQTLAILKTHFEFENKERIRKMTAQSAGFHGANNADTVNVVPPSPDGSVPAVAAAAINPAVAAAAAAAAAAPLHTSGRQLYYCWSHGLSTNREHTSALCATPLDGHKTDATASNMQGGNNTFRILRGNTNRRRPAARN